MKTLYLFTGLVFLIGCNSGKPCVVNENLFSIECDSKLRWFEKKRVPLYELKEEYFEMFDSIVGAVNRNLANKRMKLGYMFMSNETPMGDTICFNVFPVEYDVLRIFPTTGIFYFNGYQFNCGGDFNDKLLTVKDSLCFWSERIDEKTYNALRIKDDMEVWRFKIINGETHFVEPYPRE